MSSNQRLPWRATRRQCLTTLAASLAAPWLGARASPRLRLGQSIALSGPLGELGLRYRRGGASFVVAGDELPRVTRVADAGRFEAAINPEVWGRAMLEEELNRASEELGDAIARGTAADVDSSVQRIELARPLAA